MKYFVDPSLCDAHGLCYTVAPDVFRPDEDGFNADAGQTVDVPAHLESAGRSGAGACPVSAIFTIE